MNPLLGKKPIRLAAAALTASIVTGLLLYTMLSLIHSDDKLPDSPDRIEAIADPAAVKSDDQPTDLLRPTRPVVKQPPTDAPPDTDLFDDQLPAIAEGLITINDLMSGSTAPAQQVAVASPDMNRNFLMNQGRQPSRIALPVYPRKALKKGVEGIVEVEFTITEQGDVKDLALVSEAPTGFHFGDAAMKAAAQLQFKPEIVNGVASEVHGVHYTFEFEMAF